MIICGIDPGLDGGIVAIEKGRIVYKRVVPRLGKFIDIPQLLLICEDLVKLPTHHVFLELVSAMPRQGVSSMFKFGRVFGVLEGMVGLSRIPYTLVSPQSWMKVIHQGVEKSLGPKDRSKVAVSRLFPDVDLRKNEACFVPHSGLVDAVLLASYGERLLGKK